MSLCATREVPPSSTEGAARHAVDSGLQESSGDRWSTGITALFEPAPPHRDRNPSLIGTDIAGDIEGRNRSSAWAIIFRGD